MGFTITSDQIIWFCTIGFHCFLLKCKEKLRHSLGRPSRSDFVQLEFILQLETIYLVYGSVSFPSYTNAFISVFSSTSA